MKSDNLKYNKKQDSVLLCCGGKKCPEVYYRDASRVQIRDDGGFVITLSVEQAKLIPKAIEVLDGKK